MLTAFFCVSCDRASVSRAFLNSLSMTGLREADALHFGHLQGTHAIGAPQIQQLDLDRLLADGLFSGAQGQRTVPVSVPGWVVLVCWRTTSTFSPRALIENLSEGGIAVEIEREALEGLLDGKRCCRS